MNAPDTIQTSESLGDILVAKGWLQAHDVQRIVERQASQGERFGEAAIALKLLTQTDLDRALSVQFNYGYLSDTDSHIGREVVTAFKPFSKQAEEMRALRGQLMMRWFNGDPMRRVLSVVSQRPRDGRSFMLANLAVVFSQQGQRTLIIDADLRKPRQGALFNTAAGPGLAGVLAGRSSLEAIHPVKGLPQLHVLPAGAQPPNPQELVGMPSFGRLLERVSTAYDVVLVDTPAADTCSDAELVASRTGAALLLLRKNRSPLRPLNELARRLQDTGVALVGSALNHY